MQEAVSYFERAMAILDAMPDTEEHRRRRISLIVDQWIVFWLLFKTPEYYDILTRFQRTAAELCDAKLLARFRLNLGHCQ
jgi:hypothetical protein